MRGGGTLNGAGHTVLVIGDSESDLEQIRGALSTAGCRVLTRHGRQGSVSAVLRVRPDLVLLDANVIPGTASHPEAAPKAGTSSPSQGKDGGLTADAIARILSRADTRPETIVLLHSNLPAPTLRLKVLACGADGYIQKSADLTHLVREVTAWLNGQRTRSSGTVRTSGVFDPQMSLSARKAPGLRCRILFVDDDPASHSFYRKSVVVEDMTAEYVVSVQQALRSARAEPPPDVIVSEFLRGEKGLELYQTLRGSDPSWRFRFIFLTGITHAALQRLDVPVLKKPIAPEAVRDAIRYAVTSFRFLDANARLKSS
ncbi:hypothetical protein LZC95_45340 [Pendulispora brunnea]|uniref:Response regulatory domain-containing protein n=1 Tax=Pendulispora brunnea TaxID=2905690 RepID=A0ABZ2KBA1_9BACT